MQPKVTCDHIKVLDFLELKLAKTFKSFCHILLSHGYPMLHRLKECFSDWISKKIFFDGSFLPKVKVLLNCDYISFSIRVVCFNKNADCDVKS